MVGGSMYFIWGLRSTKEEEGRDRALREVMAEQQELAFKVFIALQVR